MFEFSYEVQLEVTHPSIDPKIITEKLGLTPEVQSMAGQERINARGQKLGRPAVLSHWSHRLHPEPRLNTSNLTLDKFFSQWVEKLEPHAEFIRGLVDDDAEVRFRIGWHCADFYTTAVLTPDTLKGCASLGIGFEISAIVPSQPLMNRACQP